MFYRLIKILFLSCRVLLSANYVSRYFDADGSEIISKNEVCLALYIVNFSSCVARFYLCEVDLELFSLLPDICSSKRKNLLKTVAGQTEVCLQESNFNFFAI